jgi:outer membrane protein assembly factor BamD
MLSSLKYPALALAVLLSSSCAFKHKKYENPITKDTQQPDKQLFDKAIHDIEKGRYEIARITLNTLVNTYDSSEYLAKAQLAIADAWFREGGLRGRMEAELEYKNFILFYPTMEEAAEAQSKICQTHIDQMNKADRDPVEAMKAEQECRQLLVQFPNSKFAPDAEQHLRNIQEVLAEGEDKIGEFYFKKGAYAAAGNRLGAVVEQYPLFSRADEALWREGESYGKMGPRYRPREADALQRLVRDYPLSPYVAQAKAKLKEMEANIPEPDPAAEARMRYEQENRTTPGMFHRATGFLRRAPETSSAAKSGAPTMTNPKPSIPAIVPIPGAAAGFQGDVTVAPVTDSSALDRNPDARTAPPANPPAAPPKP